MTKLTRPLVLAIVLMGGPTQLAFAASGDDDLEADIPLVLTPTRVRQSIADVPGSVSVIKAETLKRFGITSVAEALRLVPGMAVTRVSGNDYRIQYHGSNILYPRRMNVLIDGMSVYRPATARTDWTNLPVAIDDIARIEVTRGPNSASYGANSMLAIVNIVTKHPAEVAGGTVALTGGTQRTAGATVRYAAPVGTASAYRLTLDHQQDGGYDFGSMSGKDHDSTRIDRVGLRWVAELGADDTLDLQAAFVAGRLERDFIDVFQQGFPDVRSDEYYLNASWRKTLSPNHEILLRLSAMDNRNRQGWRACLPTIMLLPELGELWRANPHYARALLDGRVPAGGSARDDALAAATLSAYRALGARAAIPTCADANQDYREGRYDAELQDTAVFGSQARVVSGIGVRRDFAQSETFAGGSVRNDSWRVFSNLEYLPADPVRLNVGGYFERDQLTGSAFSPRVGLNLRVAPHHTLRLVYSRAVRMPGLFEQRVNWRYRATGFDAPLEGASDGYFYASARARGELRPERIRSTEVGYLGNFPRHGLLLDAKLFDDRLSDLISEKTQVFDFTPTNRNSARLRGAELQLTYEPDEDTALYLAYAYLRNDPTTPLEQTQYARHSGALGLSHAFGGNWRASLAWYANSASGAGQTPFSRQDLTLSNTTRLDRERTLTASLTVQHLSHRTVGQFVDFGQTEISRYDNAMHYMLALRLSF